KDAISVGGLTEAQQVAYELFAASFSQTSPDGRYILLMISLESLIQPQRRAAAVREHVQELIRATNESGLHKNEVQSIVRSLSFLETESINQAGKRLARKLERRRYKDERPAEFFRRCYEIRSNLVHGKHPIPSIQDLNERSPHLEMFIADLLSLPSA